MCWPSKINKLDAKVEAESTFHKINQYCSLSHSTTDEIKTRMKTFVLSHTKSGQRIDPSAIQKMKSLRELGRNKDLYIARFDKGNGVCIDTKANYINKMNTLLSDNSKFKEFVPHGNSRKDPFITNENKFNNHLKRLEKAGKISSEIYNKVRPVGSAPPRLYGLPKVHKSLSNPPYRPILNMRNSYASNLAKYLDTLLKPFIPRENELKDSFHFVASIQEGNIPVDNFLVSFDVKSLFTSIPVSDTIAHIISLIDFNEFPVSQTTLKCLLEMACSNVMFTFNGKIYLQKDGMAMGSSLGPTMASFAMNIVESRISSSPIYYKRYVDDIIAAFPSKESASNFLNQINTIHPNLEFTMECESNGTIQFLDTEIFRSNGQLHYRWHLKSTNTGIYIPSSAAAPQRYKNSPFQALFYRAHRLCSRPSDFADSCAKIEKLATENGFDRKAISHIKQKAILSSMKSTANNNATRPQEENTRIIYWKNQFNAKSENLLKRTTQQINHLLPENVKVRTTYQTLKTSSFFPNKDRVPSDLQSKIVYKYTCAECSALYIGESRRHCITRWEEHIKGGSNPSEIALHSHPPVLSQFEIIGKFKHHQIAESLLIKTIGKNNLLNEKEPIFSIKLF